MPTWNEIAEQLGHDSSKSAAWNRWKFWTDLGVDVGPEPSMDGPKTGTPEADEEIRRIDASDAPSPSTPPVEGESEGEEVPLFAKVERGVAKWSSPANFVHARSGECYNFDKFQIVSYEQKGARKLMQIDVSAVGELDLRNLYVTEGELRDRYTGKALVFRRRSGDGLRLDTTFEVM